MYFEFKLFQDQISTVKLKLYNTVAYEGNSSGDTGCSMVINGVINTLVDNFVNGGNKPHDWKDKI